MIDVALVSVFLIGACGAAGYAWGRWKAVVWVGVAPWASASLISDAAWMTGLWDRSSEYEPLPASMFVIPIAVPVLAIATAIGVALRIRARRTRPV